MVTIKQMKPHLFTLLHDIYIATRQFREYRDSKKNAKSKWREK